MSLDSTRRTLKLALPVHQTADLNVVSNRVLPSPAELIASLPRTELQSDFIVLRRSDIHNVIFGDDRRFLVVVGPCS
ncbi:MAG: hypothetical protein D6781_01185, partial [Verrucomicrobia bacterium]